MRGVSNGIRMLPMRGQDMENPRGFQHAMDLVHENNQLADMFKDMDGEEVVDPVVGNRETALEISDQIGLRRVQTIDPNGR
ncbi:hypothetical protein NITHO_1040005 [Nitrolancea hollandica Lb]|uniref:Uncharacterized protein n=1 Tax=Nitrolancea hollandica Lb TaxID=1129897 RepID=I4ECH0_9BACT|nr:hypothetical protein NITHO_1040005 [Nitrolancea hollandica Lb]